MLEACRAAAQLPLDTKPGSWLGSASEAEERLPAAELIACRNGLLHTPTAAVPHTPDFFCFNALAFDYEPDAPEPHEWLRFLASIWGDDPEQIAVLQEMFGLLPDWGHVLPEGLYDRRSEAQR